MTTERPPSPVSEPDKYRLGELVVDPSSNRVVHPDHEAHLKPGEMDLLVQLLEAAPDVVPSSALLDTISKGRIVEESLVHRRISRLRSALKDNARNPCYIETIPKRGYRIMADVGKSDSRYRQFTGSKASGILPFAGRRDVLERLEWHLHDVLQEHRSKVILLAGEPGIGKTRTAQELARRATASGWSVHSGWCDESGVKVPYWPWTRILRGIAAKHGRHSLPQSASAKAILAQMDPGFYQDSTQRAVQFDPDELKVRVSDVVGGLLGRLAQARPVLLLIDDLHRADQASLDLLQSVARSSSGDELIVLGTYRDDAVDRNNPIAATLARLSRLVSYDRIALSGLNVDELGELVARFSNLEPHVLDTVASKTDGNPLYATLLLQALGREPRTGLPQSVREIVVGLMSSLSEPCYRAISVSSAAGRNIDSRLVCRVMDLGLHTFHQLIDEARGSGLVVFDSDGQPRFSHALVQEAVYDAVPRAQRIEMHGAIANEMAEMFPSRDDSESLIKISRHYAKAGQPIETARWCQKAFVSLMRKDRIEAYRSCVRALDVLDVDAMRLGDGYRVAVWVVRSTINALHIVGPTSIARQEVENLFARALASGRNLRAGDALMPTLLSCYSDFLAFRGDRNNALRIAREAGDFVTHETDEGTRLHWIITLLARLGDMGQLIEAAQIAEHEMRNPPSNPVVSIPGQGPWPPYPRIVAFHAETSTLLGNPAEGLRYLTDAIQLLRKDGRRLAPEELDLTTDLQALEGVVDIACHVMRVGALCYFYLGDVSRMTCTAAQQLALCREHDLIYTASAYRLVALSHWLRGHWEGVLATHESMTAEHRGAAEPLVEALRFEALSRLDRRIDRKDFDDLLAMSSDNDDPEVLLALGRTLVGRPDLAKQDAMSKILERLESLMSRTGIEVIAPFVMELRARLARTRGEKVVCMREAENAIAVWKSIRAEGQLLRMTRELQELGERLAN